MSLWVPSKAFVSNWGGRRPDSQSITGPAGQGTLVRVDPVRRIASEGSLSIIDLNSKEPPTRFSQGFMPPHSRFLPMGYFLLSPTPAATHLSVIDTRAEAIIQNISARQNPGDLFGAQPNALAFDQSGKTLFACNGTQNAVAVFHFEAGKSKLLGLIPVGWFPGAIVYDASAEFHRRGQPQRHQGISPHRR